MPIVKSEGVSRTEKLLAQQCDRTFLRLWSYPNPHEKPGTELCDVIAVFENHVFLFFDREVRPFDGNDDVELAWQRWHRKAITAQIATAKGAKRHIKLGGKVYLDSKCTMDIPLPDDRSVLTIHQIIVAHGAKEACAAYSGKNVYGSMAISYGQHPQPSSFPFLIHLDNTDPVHVLDTHNLEIVLGELDTIADLTAYLTAKEVFVSRHVGLTYAGEEDLLAHYFLNLDPKTGKYSIGLDNHYDFMMVGEGEWRDFISRPQYIARKDANRASYLWDDLIQRTGQHILSGAARGNTDAFSPSAIREMAKETRLARRGISRGLIDAINGFPEPVPDTASSFRKLSFWRSSEQGKAYVFIQLQQPDFLSYDEYRAARSNFLIGACGIAKNKFPDLDTIVGIAMEPPKFSERVSEDLALLYCRDWSDEQKAEHTKLNEHLNLFADPRPQKRSFSDFPVASKRNKQPGRNDRCPCGSGQKYKRCHGM